MVGATTNYLVGCGWMVLFVGSIVQAGGTWNLSKSMLCGYSGVSYLFSWVANGSRRTFTSLSTSERQVYLIRELNPEHTLTKLQEFAKAEQYPSSRFNTPYSDAIMEDILFMVPGFLKPFGRKCLIAVLDSDVIWANG